MHTLLEYKLSVLKLEMETINNAILDKDAASRQLKTWAISLWTGTTTLAGVEFFAINQGDKAPGFDIGGMSVPTTAVWALATLVVPVTFLILEIYHRRVQRKFIWRGRKIHEFLNDRGPGITKAFEDNAIDEFRIYDPAGENWRREVGGDESREFEKFIDIRTVLRIPNVFVLYSALAVLSIALAVTGVLVHNLT